MILKYKDFKANVELTVDEYGNYVFKGTILNINEEIIFTAYNAHDLQRIFEETTVNKKLNKYDKEFPFDAQWFATEFSKEFPNITFKTNVLISWFSRALITGYNRAVSEEIKKDTQYISNIPYEEVVNNVLLTFVETSERVHDLPCKLIRYNNNYIWVFKATKGFDWLEGCTVFEKYKDDDPLPVIKFLQNLFAHHEIRGCSESLKV